MKTLFAFLSCKRGNVAMTTAMVLVPLLAAIGGAVDYSRTYSAVQNAQAAADSAVLAAFNGDKKKWRTRKAFANTVFHSNIRKNGRLQDLSGGLSGRMVGTKAVMTYEAKAKVNNIFGGVTGRSEQNITIRAQAEYDYETNGPPRLVSNDARYK
ncbi:MAG: pilus assembly protein TadG-related protein [Pseudomonadota bacterium]